MSDCKCRPGSPCVGNGSCHKPDQGHDPVESILAINEVIRVRKKCIDLDQKYKTGGALASGFNKAMCPSFQGNVNATNARMIEKTILDPILRRGTAPEKSFFQKLRDKL